MSLDNDPKPPIRIGRHNSKYAVSIKGIDGWVDAKDFLPIDFDVCRLLTIDGKELRGWWTGYAWDGLRVDKGEIITKWKRVEAS